MTDNYGNADDAENAEVTEITEVVETAEIVEAADPAGASSGAEAVQDAVPVRLDHVPAQGRTAPAADGRRVLTFLPASLAPIVTLAGAALSIGSALMSWTGYSAFPGDLTVNGFPGGGQWYTLWLGALVALFTLVQMNVPFLAWLAPRGANRALMPLALGLVAATWYTVLAIAIEAGGLANWDPGAFVALAGSAVALVGALSLPTAERRRRPVQLPSWIEILLIAAMMYGAVQFAKYTLNLNFDGTETEVFLAYLLAVIGVAWGLVRGGLSQVASGFVQRNKSVAIVATLVASMLFPFTQSNEAVVNIGDNILIFAGVALGLNIVVGLAGLLDLGYIAFLGCGAYAAALVSGATEAKTHWPFPVAMLIGIAVSVVAGLVIGAPTLRLRGDYLAIVTLGFGEIFRVTMNDLNGATGPKITNGPEGIFGIPNVDLFGWDLGQHHKIGGHDFGKFSNYFWLLVVLTAIIVFVFARVNNSRIGRAWVAIREDETAATAMGIDGFRFKMLAFALGAALAGLAGTVQAHVTGTVTPDQYNFVASAPPNSTFLVAAVVMGGMGTIAGPLVGAALLYLIPVKLDFLHDYQLFAFGLALILVMRLRPEGIIASRRSQLEYHEEEIAEAEAQAVVGAELAGA